MATKKYEIEKVILNLKHQKAKHWILMCYVNKNAKYINLDPNEILEEMSDGDDATYVAVFKKHFGEYVTLKL